MGYTYYQCNALTDYFPNIQYVEDLNSTFAGCTLLYGSIKNIDTPTILSSTFDSCPNLQSVNSMNISNVEDMSNCFSYCYNLRHVKIIANSNKLTNASHAFYASRSLEVFPFENKLPDSIQNCSCMFSSCDNMPSLSSNLRYQIPNNAINVSGMYAGSLNTYLRLTPVSPNSSIYAPESLNVFIYAKNIIDANSCFKSWINTGNYITNNNNNVGMLNIYVIENSVTNNIAFSYSKSFFSLSTGDCWYEN